MLDGYIDHIKKTSNKSLLARIYGVFRIKTNIFAPMDVMIMQNTVRTTSLKADRLTFDLKGSSINRYCKMTDQNFLNQKKVLKDVNFIEIDKAMNFQLLNMQADDRDELISIISKDSNFLKNQGLMDYSLLLVIESKLMEADAPLFRQSVDLRQSEESKKQAEPYLD